MASAFQANVGLKPPNVQVAAYGSHCCVHLIHSRLVLNVQYPIHLWQVPAEAARQLCLVDALLPHPLIQHHLDCGERRQHSHFPSVRRWRNIPAVVDPGSYRLL